MTFNMSTSTKLLSAACVAALFSAMPVHFKLDAQSGLISLDASVAYAKSGRDDRGSDDSGRGGGGRGGDHDDDDDDDDDNDHGRGRGSDDGAGHHSSDDHHRSGDHASNSPGAGGANGGSGGAGNGLRVVKFESTSNSMEVVFSDGSKEEIENGRYERKNTAGRTVEERRATQADVNRLAALR
ncbi:MAG: hypothetical protein WBN04_19890 [Paracoccaceae bacterium]